MISLIIANAMLAFAFCELFIFHQNPLLSKSKAVFIGLSGITLLIIGISVAGKLSNDEVPRCYNNEVVPEGASVIIDRETYKIQISYLDLETCE